MENIKKIPLLFILFILGSSIISKIQGQEKTLELINFRSGKLGNGFSYFIKHLEKPEEETSMRFYVKAGGFQEDADQLQIAHLLEHVAFKPTENFPKGIKKEVLKMNMTTQDVGATTGFNSTRYLFNAPSQNKQAILMGLNWFKEIAVGIKLTDKNINQERGSVKQEIISGMRDDLGNYYADKNLEAKLFPGRNSFDSFINHIHTFPNENLRRFYKDWYRPDLMGVMIVGNIKDMDATEQLIKSIFDDIPTANDPVKKINYDSLYFGRSPQFVIEELKGDASPATMKKVEYRLFFRQPELAKNIATKKGYKQYVAFQLLLEIMDERFQQKQIAADSSFRTGVKNTYKYGGKPLSYALLFEFEKPDAGEAFQYVFACLHQLREYGVLEEEWKRVKEKYMGNDIHKGARYWHRQLADYFVRDEAFFINKLEILRQWLQAVSVDEFNAIIKQFLSPMPEDIGIIAPTGSNALQYTEKQVRSWIKIANQQPVTPYCLPEITRELLTSREVANLEKIGYTNLGRKKNGTHEIVLENGLKIVLKPYRPTKGMDHDRIKLLGFGKIGAACFRKEDYYSALNAPSIVTNMGVGRFSPEQIKSFMEAYNIAICSPYIDFKESGIHGLSSINNIEELLQLVYIYFSQPKYDMQRFKDWEKIKQEAYHRYGKDINKDFKNRIRHFFQDSILPPTLGNHRYLKSTEAYKSVQKTNGKRSFEIYKQIFGQPQEFLFIITGDFEVNEVLPLVQKYFGNLPHKSNIWTCRNKKEIFVPIKNGPVYKEFVTDRYQMESVKYNLSYIKINNKNNPWKETIKLRVLGELVDVMLKRIRYEKGLAVYNFWALGSYNPDQSRHKINFNITCQMEEFKLVQRACQKIIQEIRLGEINKVHFQQATKSIRERYAKQTLLQHRNMQNLLYEQLRYKKPWVELEQYEKFLSSLNMQEMVKMAKKYFKKKNRYEFVMSDEELAIYKKSQNP